MTIGELKKSPAFVLSLLVLVIALVPFGIEQIGESTGAFKFETTKWIKERFKKKTVVFTGKSHNQVDWKKQLDNLRRFSDWADGCIEVKITIVRPETFTMERVDPTPATSASFSWKMNLISGKLGVSETQVRNRLSLICDPKDKVSCNLSSVKTLPEGEQGFLVTVDGVSGEGRIGLSYDGLPPVYYDVKLRRLWRIPVVSCRAGVPGRYDSGVLLKGTDSWMSEGGVITPGGDKCGYRILSISDRCVWFEAFYGDEAPAAFLPTDIWPDFSRVIRTPAPGQLIYNVNEFILKGEMFQLDDYGLMVDDFPSSNSVVFRLMDGEMRPISELLCVIVREE